MRWKKTCLLNDNDVALENGQFDMHRIMMQYFDPKYKGLMHKKVELIFFGMPLTKYM